MVAPHAAAVTLADMKDHQSKPDRNSPNPETGGRRKFIEIRESLLAQIRSGELKVGQRLPAERVLAQQIGVAHMTVRHALSQLTQEGWLTRKRGSGTYVATCQTHQNIELIVLHHGLGGLPGMIFERAQAALRTATHGLSATVLLETPGSAEEFHRRALYPKHVGGVLLLGFRDQDRPFISQLADRLPVVLLNKPVTGLSLDVVMSDREPAWVSVLEHFREKGRRRLACFCDDPEHVMMRENLNSIDHIARSLKLELPDSCRLAREGLTFEEVDRFLNGENPPDAILALTHQFARRAMVCMGERGLVLGRDYDLCTAVAFPEDMQDIGVRFPIVLDDAAIVPEALKRLAELMDSAERPKPRSLRFPASVAWPSSVGHK